MFYYSMKNHLYYTSIQNNDSRESVILKDLKYFIREESEVDERIAKEFPIIDFGNLDEELMVEGSKILIKSFQKIDAEKIDILEKLGNIRFVGFTDKDEVILEFINDGLVSSGVYSFTFDFFEDLFKLGKFANFCIGNDYHDIIKEDVTELFEKMSTIEKQFRIVMKNDEFFLRGHTSSRYNNYDNHIALYLVLLSLHKYAKMSKKSIKLENAYLSDSEISVYFEQNITIELPDIGKIRLGVLVSNSEIKESALNFEVRYKIVDFNDSNKSFSAIPDLKDAIFSINHTAKLNTVRSKISNILNLNDYHDSMLDFIKSLAKIKVLSSDRLYQLFNLITTSRMLHLETKKNFKNLYDKNLTNNTMTLIEAFNLTNTITSDINEKLHLERIYHQLLKEIVK